MKALFIINPSSGRQNFKENLNQIAGKLIMDQVVSTIDVFYTEKNLDEIIIRSLNIKKTVVEQDEKEAGLRKILNFGHTIGHGIESSGNLNELYHGECVALGMIPMCDESIKPRLINVLKKCNLYREIEYDWAKIEKATFHDKKANGDTVTITTVNEVGSFELKTIKSHEVIQMAKACLKG